MTIRSLAPLEVLETQCECPFCRFLPPSALFAACSEVFNAFLALFQCHLSVFSTHLQRHFCMNFNAFIKTRFHDLQYVLHTCCQHIFHARLQRFCNASMTTRVCSFFQRVCNAFFMRVSLKMLRLSAPHADLPLMNAMDAPMPGPSVKNAKVKR